MVIRFVYGVSNTRINISPPLIVTEEQIDMGIEVIDAAIGESL